MNFTNAKHLTACLFSLALLAASVPAHGQGGLLCSEIDSANGNAVEVYYRSTDNNMYQLVPSASTWQEVTGLTGQGPSLAANTSAACHDNGDYGDNEIYYFTTDSNGNLDVEEVWGPNFHPQNLTQATGAKPAAAGGVLASPPYDSVASTDNVFYIGTDNQVHLIKWSPNGPPASFGWTAVPSPLNAKAPAAAAGSQLNAHIFNPGPNQTEEVFYVSANGHINELWCSSSQASCGTWNYSDVTKGAQGYPQNNPVVATTTTSLAGFFDTAAASGTGTDTVFYIDAGTAANGNSPHLDELLFSSGVWNWIDITAQIGTAQNNGELPTPGTTLAAHMNTSAKSDEVYFQNYYTGTVEEAWAWSSSQNKWHVNTYPPLGYPAIAYTGTPFAVDMNGNTDQAFFITTDNLVYEMFTNTNVLPYENGAPLAIP